MSDNVSLIVEEDEWWPWLSFVNEDKYGYARGILEVDAETAARWGAGIEAAEKIQKEINEALYAKYPETGRKPRPKR